MTVVLVRHGETAFNRDGQGLGRADIPLTEVGMAQAEAVARRLSHEPVGRVVSSPLLRAFVVADRIAQQHGLEAEPLAALRELDVGRTEGMDFTEMRTKFPEFLASWAGDDGWRTRMPGGESIEDLGDRLGPLAAELVAAESSTTVVVSHNFALRALICQLLGVPLERFRAFQLDLASVTIVTTRNGRMGVRTVNDTCHLSNLNLA